MDAKPSTSSCIIVRYDVLVCVVCVLGGGGGVHTNQQHVAFNNELRGLCHGFLASL